MSDYTAMINAADDWGPASDPERRWFLAGWTDHQYGMYGDNRPSHLAGQVAYDSGHIARMDNH